MRRRKVFTGSLVNAPHQPVENPSFGTPLLQRAYPRKPLGEYNESVGGDLSGRHPRGAGPESSAALLWRKRAALGPLV